MRTLVIAKAPHEHLRSQKGIKKISCWIKKCRRKARKAEMGLGNVKCNLLREITTRFRIVAHICAKETQYFDNKKAIPHFPDLILTT
jgi:hypothetical protein